MANVWWPFGWSQSPIGSALPVIGLWRKLWAVVFSWRVRSLLFMARIWQRLPYNFWIKQISWWMYVHFKLFLGCQITANWWQNLSWDTGLSITLWIMGLSWRNLDTCLIYVTLNLITWTDGSYALHTSLIFAANTSSPNSPMSTSSTPLV